MASTKKAKGGTAKTCEEQEKVIEWLLSDNEELKHRDATRQEALDVRTAEAATAAYEVSKFAGELFADVAGMLAPAQSARDDLTVREKKNLAIACREYAENLAKVYRGLLEKEFTEIRDIRSLPGEAIKKLTSKQEAHNKAVEEVRETGSVKANKPFSLASSHDEAWLAQFITRKIKKKSKDDSQARAIMKKLSGDAEEGANDELA